MSGKSKKLFVLLLAIILTFSSIQVFASSELDQKLDEQKRIEEELEQTKKQLDEVSKQEKSVMQELGTIETELRQAEIQLDKLENQLYVVRKQIVSVEGELKTAEETVALRNDLLGRRIRAIHERGTVSYLEVLFSSTSFTDFVNRFELLQQIIRADAEILEEVRVQKALIEEKKAELEEKRSELSGLTRAAESEKRTIEARASSREQLLGKLKMDKEAYEEALDDLEKTSKDLERIIRDLQRESSGDAPSGSFVWPVSGRITSPFGMRYHPILKVYKLHTGIDIAASSGTPVKAANSGTVISSGWMGAYGYAVIIDHGGGISTLYAHHSSNLARTGDKVARGEVIARVGSTGWSTGPHLHFEVRVGGVPEDPMKWLR